MVFYNIIFIIFFISYKNIDSPVPSTLNTDFIYPIPKAEPGLNTFWLIFNA